MTATPTSILLQTTIVDRDDDWNVQSPITGRRFNLVVCIDGERAIDGGRLGRAVVCSTFHHFADMNWDADRGAPSFVTDEPGTEIKQDPARLEAFKDYVCNIADWL